jgi:4-diphosphocytidyl-2-C-methyl-D-erythritol kinase
VNLDAYYILLAYPNINSNTKDAYEGLVPDQPKHTLSALVATEPITKWQNALANDFESSIFKKYPAIKLLKEYLYAAGATYASLSGSGSAVFGIFEKEPNVNFSSNTSYYLQKPAAKIL